MRRAVGIVAAGIVVAILLTGCLGRYFPGPQPVPTAETLEGAWVHGGAELVFATDGTMTFADVPRELLEFGSTTTIADVEASVDLVDGSGDWTVVEYDGGAPFVRVTMPGPAELTLFTEGDLLGNLAGLHVAVGDPDLVSNRYRFDRE